MFAIYHLKYGYFRIGYEGDVVVSVKRLHETPTDFGTKTSLTHRVAQQYTEYFEGRRTTFDFPYCAKGTPFQEQVWNALCQIPYGETRTYQEIAKAIGNPKACRAVGMANHRNPIAIAIPCHRVVGANGKLVGYAGGLEMKAAVLTMEAQRKDKSTQ